MHSPDGFVRLQAHLFRLTRIWCTLPFSIIIMFLLHVAMPFMLHMALAVPQAGVTYCSCPPSRMDSSHERRSHRSSRHSRSPSRWREADRRRSSSRHAASHKPSRSSSHRQPDNRWTRSQERSTGDAVSPAHSEDAYMPFDKVHLMPVSVVSTCAPLQEYFSVPDFLHSPGVSYATLQPLSCLRLVRVSAAFRSTPCRQTKGTSATEEWSRSAVGAAISSIRVAAVGFLPP